MDDWNLINNDNFKIGVDDFSDLEINSTPTNGFYYFFNKRQNRLIKQFILLEKDRVDYICRATLIEKNGKFSPRLELSTRDKRGKISEERSDYSKIKLKARVDLDECHENFWKLISFLQSLREIEVPQASFSLVSQEESDIVEALRGRDVKSIEKIIRELSKTEGISLSEKDIAQLLNRKERLLEFRNNIEINGDNESWWQDFFENNKWIFGYGLNYQILKQEQDQPHYGGTRVDGTGGQRGDYLTSTLGDINFTILVEIKTPNTQLLQGREEIRNGAWSLSKELTDAISQLQANIDNWNKNGSTQVENIDRFESVGVYTVQPKGIIVIGNLSELNSRSKRETFQRLRRSLHGIDILTFDELLKRAEFIVEENSEQETSEAQADEPHEVIVSEKEIQPDDIPF